MTLDRISALTQVIEAFPGEGVDGRLRLQKAVFFLNGLTSGIPYGFRFFHFGPYSPGLQSDLELLKNSEVASEIPTKKGDFDTSVISVRRGPATADFLHDVIEPELLTNVVSMVQAANTPTLQHSSWPPLSYGSKTRAWMIV